MTIIDCPASLGILTASALIAADAVVTVALPTVKELAGVPKIEATVGDVRDAYRPELRLAAVIPCSVPPASAGALYSQALDLLRETFGDLVTHPVRRSVRVPEAYAHATPLPLHAPRDAVTADYRAVLRDLTDRGVVPGVPAAASR